MGDCVFISRKVLCEAKKGVYDCFIVVVELWIRSGADFFLEMVGVGIFKHIGGGRLFLNNTPLNSPPIYFLPPPPPTFNLT
jgi:hypothetical protein